LKYLDNSGVLDVNKCIDMNEATVKFFDIDEKNPLTYDKLHSQLNVLLMRLSKNANGLVHSQADSNSRICRPGQIVDQVDRNKIIDDQGDIARRTTEIRMDSEMMRNIYLYFMTAFIQNIQKLSTATMKKSVFPSTMVHDSQISTCQYEYASVSSVSAVTISLTQQEPQSIELWTDPLDYCQSINQSQQTVKEVLVPNMTRVDNKLCESKSMEEREKIDAKAALDSGHQLSQT